MVFVFVTTNLHGWTRILTYSSFCRMEQSSKADEYRYFERFKRFSTKIDVQKCSIAHFAGWNTL